HARGRGFHVPGFGRAQVILDEGRDAGLACGAGIVAAAHAVGDAGERALAMARLAGGKQRAEGVFVAILYARGGIAAVDEAESSGSDHETSSRSPFPCSAWECIHTVAFVP